MRSLCLQPCSAQIAPVSQGRRKPGASSIFSRERPAEKGSWQFVQGITVSNLKRAAMRHSADSPAERKLEALDEEDLVVAKGREVGQ